jgi:hypothetical protein
MKFLRFLYVFSNLKLLNFGIANWKTCMNNSYLQNNFVNKKPKQYKHNILWSKCINTIYVESCLSQIPTPYLKSNGLK